MGSLTSRPAVQANNCTLMLTAVQARTCALIQTGRIKETHLKLNPSLLQQPLTVRSVHVRNVYTSHKDIEGGDFMCPEKIEF